MREAHAIATQERMKLIRNWCRRDQAAFRLRGLSLRWSPVVGGLRSGLGYRLSYDQRIPGSPVPRASCTGSARIARR
jgi:hypothetical protein